MQIESDCPLCGAENIQLVKSVARRPEGETAYAAFKDNYQRQICHCHSCDVYFNRSSAIPSDFYSGAYNSAISPEPDGLMRRFAKIRGLPSGKSDNKLRVHRVVKFLAEHDLKPASTSILDVGCGTGVFLAEIKDQGYSLLSCIDPDPAATQHAREHVGVVRAVTGEFEKIQLDEKFDLITFNKVLEHVENPIAALVHARSMLETNGYVYVELPDGGQAAEDPDLIERSELFIEHRFAFTRGSIRHLAESAGYSVFLQSSLIDPSGKYTIYAFLVP